MTGDTTTRWKLGGTDIRVRDTLASRIPAVMFPGSSSVHSSHSVAITYDDGPVPGVTDRLLDALQATGLRVTFFMLASNATRYRALAAQCVAQGHEPACHGVEHRRMPLWTREKLKNSLQAAKQSVEDCTGAPVRLFRPPYGWWNPLHSGLLEDLGMRLVMWSCMPGDFRATATRRSVRDFLMRRLRGGDILAMHDTAAVRSRVGDHLLDIREVLAHKRLSAVPVPGLPATA